MNTQVLNTYKQLRKPTYTFNSYTGKSYQYQFPALQALKTAKRNVKVRALWNQYEDELVRLTLLPDYDCSYDDLAGDTFDPEVNYDVPRSKLEKEEQEFKAKIDRDGVWGIVGQYKCDKCGTNHWITADSVWGFVGDDWKDSGYDIDIMQATLKAAGLWTEE